MIQLLKKPLFLIFLSLMSNEYPTYGGVGPNLFQFEETWKDDSGQTVKLATLKGKKIVFAMVYTSCQSACPLITKKMKAIEKKLDDTKVAAEFLIVSFDTEHESEKSLTHFRKHMGLDSKNWHLLRGLDSATRKLANLFDVKFSKKPDSNEIMHDNKIFLINESGELVKTLEGLTGETKELF